MSIKILGPQNFDSQKIGPTKFLGPKKLGVKNFRTEKVRVEQNFSPMKILIQKKLRPPKIGSKKFGQIV